ncbi:DNA-binding LacI/PurR family transcriptional regulator [Motilibacter peucedani]|uniref:DNA-binding LacI/PurR family transcriptional regulator n=1 Tax=Motilibacter peucedani TaxID=598650 RepID=A0A420XLZ5_9ACTN|nr:LacI family DNA-binding transcriptional regulator [Motilibacter peucedani]RKS71433.1 DNA-binding LacI/PurR family transcriptional regulator [Motilibacter peucedani]
MTPDGARPTLEQVASLAGVSRATVSRVVNDSPRVAPDLREKVEAAIRQLGYVPNMAARSLATRRSNAIALVVGESASFVFSDPFFGGIVRTASREIARRGLQMVLLMAHDPADYTRVESYLEAGHVDGALLFSLHRVDDLPALAARIGLPVVVGGRPWNTDAGSWFVDMDNRAGARLATEHLLGLGRRRIATITGPLDMTAGIDRLEGFVEAMGGHDAVDPDLVAHGAFTQESGEIATERLLERVPDLDAIFAASDLMAAGALRVLRRAGKQVPRDVAVVGFDDHDEIARWTEPSLTTIHQDIEEWVARMVTVLDELIRGEASERQVLLPTRLVVRESA